MKIVYSKLIPLKGYTAMTIYPFIFVRKDRKEYFTEVANTHESIHALQQIEILWIFFFLWYLLEWLVKIPFCKFNPSFAYRSISFEQEAYYNQYDKEYLQDRRHYCWMKFVFRILK